MRTSPFAPVESRLGAELTGFAGWTVPGSYGDPATEYRAARRTAAVIDGSSLGRIKVTGKDRVDLLHRLCTQDLLGPLGPGRGLPAVFTTNKGRIVDRTIVVDRGESLLLVTGPGTAGAVVGWVRKYTVTEDVSLTDLSSETGAFRVTGPEAVAVMRALGEFPGMEPEPHRAVGIVLGGIETTVLVEEPARRPGFLLVAEMPGAVDLFERAVGAARAIGGGPAGETARQVLRIEDGLPEAGAELTEDFNPWEARLDAAISLTKGCYVGQEVVARLNTYDKVSRRLAGLRMKAAAAPERGAQVRAGGQVVGTLTSSAVSLETGEAIGLGYLRVANGEPGSAVSVVPAEGAEIAATVAALPLA